MPHLVRPIPSLDAFPQAQHGRWPVRHTVICNVAKGCVGELTEVGSGMI